MAVSVLFCHLNKRPFDMIMHLSMTIVIQMYDVVLKKCVMM